MELRIQAGGRASELLRKEGGCRKGPIYTGYICDSWLGLAEGAYNMGVGSQELK